MLNNDNRIAAAVHRAVGNVSDALPTNDGFPPDDAMVLIGQDAALDSMGFVNFIVALEEELERELGRDISIAELLNLRDSDGDNVIATVGDVIRALSERLP